MTVLPRIIEWAHLAAAMLMVGGQLVMTYLTLRPLPTDDDGRTRAVWMRIEQGYRHLALGAVMATAVLGVLLARYTVVTPLLLVTTPYGPLLAIKTGLTILFLGYLLVGPAGHTGPRGESSRAARVLALAASGVVLGATIVSQMLRYT